MNQKNVQESKVYKKKIILIGDMAVGKTSIILSYKSNMLQNSPPTMGVEFTTIKTMCEEKEVILSVYDTAGQDKFRNMVSVFFRNSDVAILVFSLDNKESFMHIENWIDSLEEKCETCRKILVGNKCDCPIRQTSSTTAKTLAEKYQMEYIETSALKEINIKKLFETAARESLKQEGENSDQEESTNEKRINIDIDDDEDPEIIKPKNKCCQK